MAFRGIDIRQTSDRLVFRALLQDSGGDLVTSGTTTLKLYELQSDGTLKSYDFDDDTFKATALTTETLSMTHRTGNNGTTNTGLWSVTLTTLTGFTKGDIYFAMVNNAGASPKDQHREFQFGSAAGDLGIGSDDRVLISTDAQDLSGSLDVNAKTLGADAITASAVSAGASGEIADAVWDEARSGHVSQGTFGEALGASVTQSGKVSDASANVQEFDTDLISTTDGHYDGQLLVMMSGSAKGEVVPILHYEGSTGKLRFAWPLRTAPANNDEFVIVPWGRLGLPGVALETTIGYPESSTELVLRDVPGTDDDYNGMTAAVIDVSTGQVSYRTIVDFDSSEQKITISSALDFTPAGDDIVQILGTAPVSAVDLADAVLDELLSGHQSAGSLGAELHLVRAMLASKRTHTISTGVDEVMDDDGSTLLRTMTPADDGDDTITVEPS